MRSDTVVMLLASNIIYGRTVCPGGVGRDLRVLARRLFGLRSAPVRALRPVWKVARAWAPQRQAVSRGEGPVSTACFAGANGSRLYAGRQRPGRHRDGWSILLSPRRKRLGDELVRQVEKEEQVLLRTGGAGYIDQVGRLILRGSRRTSSASTTPHRPRRPGDGERFRARRAHYLMSGSPRRHKRTDSPSVARPQVAHGSPTTLAAARAPGRGFRRWPRGLGNDPALSPSSPRDSRAGHIAAHNPRNGSRRPTPSLGPRPRR